MQSEYNNGVVAMINLIPATQSFAKCGIKLSGNMLLLAAMACPALVLAAPTATSSSTATPYKTEPMAPASASSQTESGSTLTNPTNNNIGATSGGGSFFVPQERRNDGAMSADKALKSTEVPEPGVVVLFGGVTLLTLAVLRRRQKR